MSEVSAVITLSSDPNLNRQCSHGHALCPECLSEITRCPNCELTLLNGTCGMCGWPESGDANGRS